MESHLRVTKGACPPPLLRSVSLRRPKGVEGALGYLLSEYEM